MSVKISELPPAKSAFETDLFEGVQAGQNRRSRSNSCDALRHGSTGATAMRASRARPIGIVIRSKYGRPTVIRSSLSAPALTGFGHSFHSQRMASGKIDVSWLLLCPSAPHAWFTS